MSTGSISEALTNSSNDSNTPTANAVVSLAIGCTATLIAPRIVLTAGHCINKTKPPSIPGPSSGDWETPGQWYPLYNYPGGIQVRFGNDSANWIATIPATQYCIAGFDDVVMLGLATSVPTSIAIPAIPLTRLMTNPDQFLVGKTFRMVGWGPAVPGASIPRFRQTATCTAGDFPFTSFGVRQPNMLSVLGNSQVIPGDSGSPLFWKPSGSSNPHLIGVAQGSESAPRAGRYVVVFGKGGPDSNNAIHPDIAKWIEARLALRVRWNKVGAPLLARKIALSFDGGMYALNADKSLWVNHQNGRDGQWTKVRDLPSGAISITSGAGAVYSINQQHELWALNHNGEELWKVGRPNSAAEVAATEFPSMDHSQMWALNDDKTLWKSDQGGRDSSWEKVGKPLDAVKIAAAEGKIVALNTDGSLWLNEQDGKDSGWQFVGMAKEAIEISAASVGPDRLFRLLALNRDYSLWEGWLEPGDVP